MSNSGSKVYGPIHIFFSFTILFFTRLKEENNTSLLLTCYEGKSLHGWEGTNKKENMFLSIYDTSNRGRKENVTNWLPLVSKMSSW